MVRILFSLTFLFCFSWICSGQSDIYSNQTFVPYIKSIQVYVDGSPFAFPAVGLGGGQAIGVEFDDTEGGEKSYHFTLAHCNADWTPSNLSEFEYIDGFARGTIRDFDFSHRVLTDYTHYWFYIPNEDLQLTKSGNYVLRVFNNDGRSPELVFTYRFVVYENEMNIEAKMVRPAFTSKMDSHHEIDFLVNHEGKLVRNPMVEMKATVIQNRNWTTAIQGIKPQFTRSEVQVFDYQDKVVFNGMNEFRPLDLRKLNNGETNLGTAIRNGDNTYRFNKANDQKRGQLPYYFSRDVNGGFVIDNQDLLNIDAGLEAEYVWAYLTLESPTEYEGETVHVLGEAFGYQANDQNKMVYNLATRTYVGRFYLKQGYYDYVYAIKDAKGNLDYSITEGDYADTEHLYSIIVYYRPFGERYDRVVAFSSISR